MKKDLNMDTLNDMLGALSTRKRPCDMEDILDHKVYSKGRDEWIRIGDMALEHVLRKYYLLLNSDRFDKKKPSDTQVYHDLHAKIAKLDEMLEEKDEMIVKETEMRERWRQAYYEAHTCKGDIKMFSEIPNNDEGWDFVNKLKKYLNRDSYKTRVRGQYLIDGENWRKHSFGQPIEKSKCLRVYVDKI